MTKKQGLNEWWAIRDASGIIFPDTIRNTLSGSWRDYWWICCHADGYFGSWKAKMKANGYRAVKVRITEIKEWGE